jgi:predicted transcriptional regulator
MFDGADVIPSRDELRLFNQLDRVWFLMKDGRWRTLDEISELTGDPPASISAQLRNLRKKKFGSHVVERQYIDSGLYKYRVTK